MGEFDLAGGESGGGGAGEGTVEDFVIEKLVGDRGELGGGKDGNRESEAVLIIVIVFCDNRGEGLGEFD